MRIQALGTGAHSVFPKWYRGLLLYLLPRRFRCRAQEGLWAL